MSVMTLDALADLTGSRLEGDGAATISGVNSLVDAGPNDIAILTNSRYRRDLAETGAGVVILEERFSSACPTNMLIHDNPYYCYAQIAAALFPRKRLIPQIHSSALIDESAAVSRSARIGPMVVIENGVEIGDSVEIGAGCVVMSDSKIAAGSCLLPQVTIMPKVQIGRECLIHPGVVIGSDGFGFARDRVRWVKVPQVGTVIIGDNVEIGANTTIDRGSIRDTVIADGVKLDNQIQIAHNVTIGEHTAIAACVGIAGSTRIGKGCTIGGMAGIVGHLDIADGTHVAAKTLVTRSITAGGSYSGALPAVPTGSWRRIIARIRHIDELFQRVKVLEKKRGKGSL